MLQRAGRRAARTLRRVERGIGPPLVVLAYHRVAEPAVDPWALSVAPARFAEQLDWLTTHGDVVPLREGLAHFRSRLPRRRPLFSVTFDDGYVDNLLAALPVLERYDVPATVFVPTSFTGTPSFWWDRLDHVVATAPLGADELADAFVDVGLIGASLRTTVVSDRERLHQLLHEEATDLGPDEIDARLDIVIERLGTGEPDPAARPMTSDELVTLAGHPLITIGAHTAAHRMLPKLDDAAVLGELQAGSAALDALLGPHDRVLAYPHGRADRRVERLVAAAGFRHALTTAGRPVSRLDRPRHLPRVDPRDVGVQAPVSA